MLGCEKGTGGVGLRRRGELSGRQAAKRGGLQEFVVALRIRLLAFVTASGRRVHRPGNPPRISFGDFFASAGIIEAGRHAPAADIATPFTARA